jgi:hypothetical protein
VLLSLLSPLIRCCAFREGRLPLLLTQALSVAAHVFTDSPLPISYDRLMLTDGGCVPMHARYVLFLFCAASPSLRVRCACQVVGMRLCKI